MCAGFCGEQMRKYLSYLFAIALQGLYEEKVGLDLKTGYKNIIIECAD